MAELNFGLLTPPGSQSIGNAFISGMDQAQAARLQEQQLQQSMQQNALAKAKMGEYQRGIAEQNALRNRMTQPGFDINNPQHQQELLGIAPVLGQTVLQHAATMAKTGAETARFGAQTEEARVKAVQAKRAFRDQGLRDMANNPSDANIIANHEDAVLQKMMTPEESAKQIDTLLKLPFDQRKVIFERAGAPAAAPEKAPAPPATVAEYTFAKTPAGGNFVGTFQDFVTARAKAGRAPAQPSAPTITQIVDPTDATKMITIDARRYTGGGAGSPGVIGVSGKEPTAALRENKIESGKSLLADEISNLRAALNTLNAARAIPSTERGALSNISSSLASSGVGQIAGRIVGTEAQTERDVISSSKLRLVNAIKQATGMSAQQLNSNVELQTMLKSLSDPSQSIEANIRNLDNIEKSYVNATSAAMPRASAAATTSKAAPASTIDALLNKYK